MSRQLFRNLVVGLLAGTISGILCLALSFDQLLMPVLMIFGACFLLFGIVLEFSAARGLVFVSRPVSDEN